ncbi:MAG: hypothetical protein II137_04040 [Anaerovibrio sp.]|nr:hypothetical protein [Anaerovibrio sp.]
MLLNVRDVKRQKGQGIVEYALLLAFILAIAVAMQGSGIDTAISNTFTRVAQALGVETEQDKWATADINSIMDDKESAAGRLKSDQDFLKNIGRYFIDNNFTREQIQTMLGTSNNSNVLLGNFIENNDGTTYFSNELRGDGSVPETGELFNWATGAAAGTQYDTSRRYLVSDYALHNIQSTTKINGQNVVTGNGIKIMGITYDGNGKDAKVKSIRIAVNPNSGKTGEGYSRSDLDVTVNR